MALDMHTVPGLVTGWDARDASALEWSDSERHTAHTLPEGLRLLDYEIVGPIGEGGFGIVYLAWDHALEQHVAIKEYLPAILASRASVSPSVVVKSQRHQDSFRIGLRSFLNEARILARFDHPSLVRVLHFWEGNGTAYMAMPYYEGPTLQRALEDLGRPPDEAELRGWLQPLLDALGTMHASSCFHRDISPDNILLTDSGPVLLDFGAARRVIDGMGSSPTVVFKPGYAPIEQYGEVAGMKQGAWTDLYALASVVYAAVTGHAPTPSIERLMEDQLQPLSEVARGRYSETFLAAIDAALALHPKNRPQSAAEFWTMLSCGRQLQGLDLLRAVRRGDVLSQPQPSGVRIVPDHPAAAEFGREEVPEPIEPEWPASVPPVAMEDPALDLELGAEPKPELAEPMLPVHAKAVPARKAVHVSDWPPLRAAPGASPLRGRRLTIAALATAVLVVGAAVVGLLYFRDTPEPVAEMPTAPEIVKQPVKTPVSESRPVSVSVFKPASVEKVAAPAAATPQAPPRVQPEPAPLMALPPARLEVTTGIARSRGEPLPASTPAQTAAAVPPAPAAASVAAVEPAPRVAPQATRVHAESSRAPRREREPRNPEAAASAMQALALRPAPSETGPGPATCTDILQRASLGPLTPAEAAQLKKGCE
jgi:serine/threonine protein kinase